MAVLDDDGAPLRPAKLWNDTESAPDAATLSDAFGGADWWAERVGLVPVASFTATKWAWLRRVEPEVASATTAIRLPHDFLTERLCGRGRRAAQIPEVEELVGLGAAAQAASMLSGENQDEVARRWNTRRGTLLAPVPRDDETRDRINQVRELLRELNGLSSP